MYAKFYQNIQKVSRDRASFTVFFSGFEPRPISNDIWQSLGLHLVNINVYAKFHHNSPLNSAIFTFFRIWSSAQSRPMLNVILQFHSIQEIGPFSLFQNLELGKASTDEKCRFPWARACQYQCVCKSLSKYSKWFTSYRQSSRTLRGQNLHKQARDKIFIKSGENINV